MDTLVFDKERVLVGRDSGADVVLDNAGVSRQHASIEHGPMITIRDLCSANGTFVNGERVTLQELRDGDVVGIGRFQLHMRIPRSPRNDASTRAIQPPLEPTLEINSEQPRGNL